MSKLVIMSANFSLETNVMLRTEL